MNTCDTHDAQATAGPRPVLVVEGLSRDFGGLRALNDLDVTSHRHLYPHRGADIPL